MLNDHVQVAKSLQSLAEKEGVPLPVQPDARTAEKLEALVGEVGPHFDQHYLSRMAQNQAKSLALFEKAEEKTRSPAVRALAAQALPYVKVHIARLDPFNVKPR
jgi:predicted outer membrane protein